MDLQVQRARLVRIHSELDQAAEVSGVDLSQNKGVGQGQSGQAIKLFQAPQKLVLSSIFDTSLSSLTNRRQTDRCQTALSLNAPAGGDIITRSCT